MDKKGAEGIIWTVVVLVLVVLVLGFTGGWSNLWSRISGYFGGSNVDSVVQACNVACTINSMNDFCSRVRIVKGDGLTEDTSNKIYAVKKSDNVIKSVNGTCQDLAKSTAYQGMGFTNCPDLC